MTTPLPKRDERSAPKFDPKNEALLPNFFAEFERTAKAAGIDTDARLMKRAVIGYLDAKTFQFWQTLDTFGDDSKTWDEFKAELLEYYPGASTQIGATTEELVKIVDSFRRRGISTATDLNEFHREFAVVAKALGDQGVMSGNPIAKHYVSALPDHVRWRIDQALLTFFPDQNPNQAYTISQLRKVATRLLADTSAPAGFENFRVGDLSKVPGSVVQRPSSPKIKTEPPEDEPLLSQQLAVLTQMVTDLKNEVRERPPPSRDGRSSKSNKGCAWDRCPAKSLKECADLADWVAKGKVEQNERGYVRLRSGESLPRDERFQKGLVKERFEKYFNENPTARTWILDIPPEPYSPPERAGIEVRQHTAYSLQGYQGPSMLATAAAYALQSETDPGESALVRDLIFKMETRRMAKDRTEARPSSTSTQNSPPTDAPKANHRKSAIANDPEPSVPIPQRIVAPTKPPKPIIGKLPDTYVSPQERNLGATPKEDRKSYRYRAPIETEQAMERVLETGMQSLVSIRQDDLLAIAPDYRQKVKEAITSKRVGLDGALLEDTGLLEDVNLLDAGGGRKAEQPFSVYFNDFGPAEEGDEYFVAKETHPIRGVNAIIGERAAHCVLDGGCSLVAASLAACNALGLAFDPGRKINLQSANETTNWSLGLAKDVPFRFGEVLAFLQVQVVDTPAYDFLLGRPFEVLMQATYKNFHSGDQHITLVDPNSSKVVTIPTLPREPPRFRKEDGRELRK
ncbi:hypothetical protein FB446DRAFT_510601 [Lentinula raphanica]|nr:hypothetical protein FB446DRAFT_510601 [Lentinula raphanica]